MTRHYPEIWRALQDTVRFDKYASEGGEATVDLAAACSRAFDAFTAKSASYGDVGTPTGAAKAAASFAVDLYATGTSMGEKTASVEFVTDTIEQLATVAYLDATLKTASEGLSGTDLEASQRVRLLGREYGVELLKSLVR